MTQNASIDWSSVPADPDPHADLGYDLLDLEVFEPENGTGEVVFLPAEEDLLREDAFIVAPERLVSDLYERV